MRDLLICVLAACVSAACHRHGGKILIVPPADRSGYSAEPADFFGVYFKAGQPFVGDDTLSSLSKNSGNAEESLQHDLKIIQSSPQSMRFAVHGFTDISECEADQCIKLSERRAQLIYDWLIKHGVAPERLNSPYGYGSARPVGDTSTEQGRANNRRVSIEFEKIN